MNKWLSQRAANDVETIGYENYTLGQKFISFDSICIVNTLYLNRYLVRSKLRICLGS